MSYGHTFVTDRARPRSGWCRSATATASRARRPTAPRCRSAGAARRVVGSVCMDQLVVDLGDADSAAAPGDEVVLIGPGDARRADRAGLGRVDRHDRVRGRHPARRPDRPPAHRAAHRERPGVEAGARGRCRPWPARPPRRRPAVWPPSARWRRGAAGGATQDDFGSLRSEPHTVVADDGVPLHVEVDEADPGVPAGAPTLVFVHGYILDLDCWHFQRAALRGRLPDGVLRPAQPRPVRPLDAAPQHHRPAGPRPGRRARPGRADRVRSCWSGTRWAA